MSQRIDATIYYGPPSWFQEQTQNIDGDSFLDIIFKRDAESRRHIIVPSDASVIEAQPEDGPVHLVVNSGDYASLVEGAISNFGGIIQSIDPKNLYLNNPPEQVRTHVERIADVTEVQFQFS